jgi:hypothetical protein
LELYVQERRKIIRGRVLKNARFVVGASSTLDCVVRNLSNVGARVQIQDTTSLPERVDMTFDGGRTLRPCRIVWRTLNATGVQFLENDVAV